MITCDIVKDLQPLYADGFASKESREAVRHHLAGCRECRRFYSEIGIRPASPPSSVKESKSKYLQLAKRLRQRTALMIGGAVIALCAAGALSILIKGDIKA